MRTVLLRESFSEQPTNNLDYPTTEVKKKTELLDLIDSFRPL